MEKIHGWARSLSRHRPRTDGRRRSRWPHGSRPNSLYTLATSVIRRYVKTSYGNIIVDYTQRDVVVQSDAHLLCDGFQYALDGFRVKHRHGDAVVATTGTRRKKSQGEKTRMPVTRANTDTANTARRRWWAGG